MSLSELIHLTELIRLQVSLANILLFCIYQKNENFEISKMNETRITRKSM